MSSQWREYAGVLIAERVLQWKIEFYNSPAMERGLIVEAEAADWYEPTFPGFRMVVRSGSPLRASWATANRAPRPQQAVEPPVDCAEGLKRAASPASRRNFAVVGCRI
jgi:hypothetical protein